MKPAPLTKLEDSPEYTTAAALLADLRQRRSQAEAELEAAIVAGDRRKQNLVACEVAELLGQPVDPKDLGPDVAALSHDAQVLRIAVQKQEKIVDEIAMRLERETVKADRPAHDQTAREILGLLMQLELTLADYAAHHRSRRQRFNGNDSLPSLGLLAGFVRLLPGAIHDFREGLKHYQIEFEGPRR